MANNPKKAKDPTEVALSAIQDALNISENPAAERDSADRHEVAPSLSAAVEPGFDDGPFSVRSHQAPPAFEPLDEPRFGHRAANDDRETIGQILQAIQKGRPARSVYTLATFFTGIWLLGAGLLAYSFYPSLQALAQGGGDNAHTMTPGNRPSSAVILPKLDAFTLGQLLALEEHKTAALGALWNINAFDQFGVELGKQMAKQRLA